MPLYLVHLKYDGSPVGIWNSHGESYYLPGQTAMEKRGDAQLSTVTDETPWTDLVERKIDLVNHQEWWEDLNSTDDLQTALEKRIVLSTSQKANISPVDK